MSRANASSDAGPAIGAANLPVADLTELEARTEWERIAEAVARANAAYHTLDAPEISDADYDRLKRRLQAIEARFPELAKADSPTGQVGAAPSETFSKIRHEVRMLSLENAFDAGEVVDFDDRIRKFLNIGANEAL
ncbi:MAG: NAD-dependent DNA ligase LigA, partial [Paracoccaceae bacterium]|nr:NAD-dependent DNA ligase LigA [Paracoccaceae bacterium]